MLIYTAVVIILVGFVLVTILSLLRKATDRREERFKKRKGDSLMANQSSFIRKNSSKRRKTGLDRIEEQFTITKKIIVPSIIISGIIIAVIPFLNKFPAAVLSFFIAGFSLILGMALKPLLENVFAGLVISYSKSLNIGDTVLINDKYGTVEDIALSYTTIRTWDWTRYVLPNAKMLQQEFINLTLTDRLQWAFVEFYAAYENDIELVREIALECARTNPYTARESVPEFWVIEMRDDCYKCWVASWTEDPSKSWAYRSELRIQLMKAFEEKGIRSFKVNHYVKETSPNGRVADSGEAPPC